MSQHFDIIVIGSGPGGYVAALKAAQMGAKTAVVEFHPFFGGTCLNWGCIPSKALLASASLIHEAKHSADFGVNIGGEITFDWTKIQARKDKVLATNRGGIKGLFAARKVTTFQGHAALDGPGRVVIQKDGQPAETITGTNIILATGSVPFRIPGWPTDPEFVCTSDEALHWKTLPQSLLIVGGGVIGCEFACMMHEFGVKTTVVELLPKFLGNMDQHVADELMKSFKKRGIACYVDTKVEDMKLVGPGVEARLSNGETIKVDRVLVATGRRPATQNLGLESVGLTTDRGFIRVDDHMETPVKGIYCIGDANGRALLAHAASAHGVCAVENALGHETIFNAPIPGAVYTFPEAASVGMTQEQCEAKNIPIAVGAFPFSHLGKALAVGATEGFIKVIRSREDDALLGVHMLGHNVTEIIASASCLLHQRVKVQDVIDMVFAHPTMSEAFHEAAEDAHKAALHLPPKQVMRVAV